MNDSSLGPEYESAIDALRPSAGAPPATIAADAASPRRLTGAATAATPVTARHNRAARRVKRMLDALIATMSCVCLSPLFLAIALGIKLSGRGPVLYRRRVVGRGGATFDAFKFRTMKVDADRMIECDAELWASYLTNFKLPRDPRITPFGRVLRKFSLDELPQLFNVIRGQMSLVGPRMITEAELSKYGDNASRLLTVRPGLTGLWQVSGRQTTTYERRVELDMAYIDRWSLWLDFCILCKTPLVVIRAEGAF
jgi:lipopolysaccharide/colanic/teichoic acid biosynthesis glycosyltransferase